MLLNLLGHRLRRGLLNHGRVPACRAIPPPVILTRRLRLLVCKGDELDAIQQRRMMEMMGGQAGGVSEH